MKRAIFFVSVIFISIIVVGQKIETVYLDAKDSTSNMYVAVIPESGEIKSFMFLLDGFGNYNPKNILMQSNLPKYAATKGVLSIMPILKTGPLYFGSDNASQESLKNMIEAVVEKYKLSGKSFYIGGFSIGGTCVVKYAELAVKKNYSIKPKAIFAVDPPLDWERIYNSAKRIVRLSDPAKVDQEVTYIIGRIEKEMGGNPETAKKRFYENSPYSYSDTTQTAIKNLINVPIMLFTEPDIEWWLKERGYDYSYINVTDHGTMINELQRLGNKNAVLVTTTHKGYRQPNNVRHPHSWSIADPIELTNWLLLQK